MTKSTDGLNIVDPNLVPEAQDHERELARFEAEERARLGLDAQPKPRQWRDDIATRFTASQRAHTTLLVSGLTMAHDAFVTAAWTGIGYRVKALDCPDYESLRYGKEFGNRGQCSPTYFTVGNLVKFLCYLRDEQGVDTQAIVDGYVFVTAGACGPCRFGTYVTEYRKALRDAGFDGFRVLLFEQTGGLSQATGEDAGLEMSPPFFIGLVKALMLGDVLNVLGYRIRPYEVNAGETDAVLEECKALISAALKGDRALLPALWAVRGKLNAIPLDRTRVKPKVALIGEFWAMTTEGDGNYQMQRFLEQEGAEVDVQTVTAWLLYMLWEAKFDIKRRLDLKGEDGGLYGLEGQTPWKTLALLAVGDKAVRLVFHSFAHLTGLSGYHLPDMDQIAELGHRFYDNSARGGEGHMEVSKLILNVAHQKVNMTLSVKPFGCMPSSGVSDGVQTLVTALHPSAIFLPIETSGDGAVNAQSRVQMMLFKARQSAQKEVAVALEKTGLDLEAVRETVAARFPRSLWYAPHEVASSAANVIYAAARRRQPAWRRAATFAQGLITPKHDPLAQTRAT